jgi:hypothetical protein
MLYFTKTPLQRLEKTLALSTDRQIGLAVQNNEKGNLRENF